MKDKLIKGFLKAYRAYAHLIPTDRKTLIFESSGGNNYSGNPKAIYEELLSSGRSGEYKIYWSLKKGKTADIPGDAQIIYRKTSAYFKAFARAGFWISDSRMPLYLVKKSDVTYIQTWHGTPLKKLALDMTQLDMGGSTNIDKYQENFRRNSAYWDYLISQNPYSSAIFRRCFDFHGQMLEIGYPRCDSLIRENSPERIRQLKEELGLPQDKKIILYAPTWRDNDYVKKGEYRFHAAMDFKAMQEALGRDYILLVKYHYLMSAGIDFSPYEGFVYNFTQASDITPLYLVSDCMITDYSSTMFDYAILEKPMYFFCYDLEDYRDNLRGFYFNFQSEAPGPISQTTEDLIQDILDPKTQEKFAEAYHSFHEKFVPIDNGHASEKVLKLIMEDA